MNFFFYEILELILFLGFWASFGYLIYLFFAKRNQITDSELKKVTFPKKMGWTIGIAILAYNVFLYETMQASGAIPGVGWGLFIVAIIGGLLLSFPAKKRTPLVYFLAVLSSVSALIGVLHASAFIQSFNLVVTQLSFYSLLFLYVLPGIQWEGLWILKAIWHSILQAVRHVLVLFKLSFKLKNAPSNKIIRTLKTVFLTLLLLLLFASLLSQADPIFDQLISEIKEEAAARTFLSLLLAAGLLFGLSLQIKPSKKTTEFKLFNFYDVVIPIIAIELLFLFFLFIQGKYLFGSHEAIANFDLTYSEYVRKGFTELLTTTFLGGIIAYLVILKTKTTKTLNRSKFLRGLNVILVIELMALLSSALKRDLLYVEVYGLTRVRLIGGIFLAWLAATLIMLLITNINKRLQEKHLFLGVFVISIATFLCLNTFNMDLKIATTEPPEGQHLDYFYLTSLSVDAAPGWETVIQDMNTQFDTLVNQQTLTDEQKTLLTELKLGLTNIQEKRITLEDKFGDLKTFEAKFETKEDENSEEEYDYYYYDDRTTYNEWQQDRLKARRHWVNWNWGEQKNFQYMENNSALFTDQVDCLLTSIENYQIDYLVDLQDETWERMYDYEYPFISDQHSYYEDLNSTIMSAFYEEEIDWDNEEGPYGKGYLDLNNLTSEQAAALSELQAIRQAQSCSS
ncbi:DUF4173 domain-containing protein [Candidatus Peregrinibacteria bacterium]|jgi:hypothetical protein|nr:DUF4173 domain-containing protein [Candidatus Peregrinibacteria bacterium]MBT7483607.1 DUF4173 domain-containing protein [Candidatus Peregrinibacteria bacterium]MBT7702900.1 DUF4173 domain-containing protein [Candidatus Peregrinibacteria bacterium]